MKWERNVSRFNYRITKNTLAAHLAVDVLWDDFITPRCTDKYNKVFSLFAMWGHKLTPDTDTMVKNDVRIWLIKKDNSGFVQ